MLLLSGDVAAVLPCCFKMSHTHLCLRFLSFLLLRFSSPSRPAKSTCPERGQLPHHSSPPRKSYGLCKSHSPAGSHLPDHLRQSALHPQQHGAASASQTQQQLGTAARKRELRPVCYPPQLASSPSLLCRNQWSPTVEQDHTTHTQVRV